MEYSSASLSRGNYFFFFETGSYVAEDDLEILNPLSLTTSQVLGMELSSVHARHITNGTALPSSQIYI